PPRPPPFPYPTPFRPQALQQTLLASAGTLLGGAAGGLGGLGPDVDGDERGAERLDLLGGARPHVEPGDHGTQAPGGGDGLEAGDTGAEDQHVGRADRAGGGGEHREDPVAQGGRFQRGLVAGERGLGGQDVHRLGPGRAGDQFECQQGGAGGDERAERVGGAQRVEWVEQAEHGPGATDPGRVGPFDTDEEVRSGAVADGGAGFRVLPVTESRTTAGAGVARDAVAVADQLTDAIGGERYPPLPLRRGGEGVYLHAPMVADSEPAPVRPEQTRL